MPEPEDEQCPDTSGFLGIAGGFVLKNPIKETLTVHGVRAVTGVMGGLFQLQENF